MRTIVRFISRKIIEQQKIYIKKEYRKVILLHTAYKIFVRQGVSHMRV